MPSTARQLRQPPTIEAISRVPYFTDVRKGIEVLKENGLGNIKKKLKIKELVKGNKRARLFKGSTTSI